RSRTAPHARQVQVRTCRGLGPSFTPHAEHTCDVGSYRPIRMKVRPYRAALYFSRPTNADHPASWTGLGRRVRASPFPARSSPALAWFSRISLVESWWWNLRRASATRACARATLSRAFSLFLLPF